MRVFITLSTVCRDWYRPERTHNIKSTKESKKNNTHAHTHLRTRHMNNGMMQTHTQVQRKIDRNGHPKCKKRNFSLLLLIFGFCVFFFQISIRISSFTLISVLKCGKNHSHTHTHTLTHNKQEPNSENRNYNFDETRFVMLS